jgi:hypothetical protein
LHAREAFAAYLAAHLDRLAVHAGGTYADAHRVAYAVATQSGYLAAYELDRAYGGPEEGGWYYDTGTLAGYLPADRYVARVALADAPEGVPELAAAMANGYGRTPGGDADGFVEFAPLEFRLWRHGPDGIALVEDSLPLRAALVAAIEAQHGEGAFDRDASSVRYRGGAFAVEWRDATPEAFYPAGRPCYE